jgi:glyoxylase-like metal-dependent hydrolase (beta-lactamase superfamily II)
MARACAGGGLVTAFDPIRPVRLHAHNPGPMTGSGNATYLISAGGAGVLIDAGTGDPRHLADLHAALTARHSRLVQVLVTHGHPDHASGAPALSRAHPSATFHKRPWADGDQAYAVEWRPIADGDEFDAGGVSLVAMHTPGHSPDHVAFWEPASRTLYSGDLVTLGSSVMIHASRGGDLADYLASLQRMRTLAPERLLPAHGPEITDPETILRGYIEHRLMREQQVLAALTAGRETVPSIADYIYDGLDPRLMPAARENVHAHLEKLRREGRAFVADARWRL